MTSPIASTNLIPLFPTFVWQGMVADDVRNSMLHAFDALLAGVADLKTPLGRGESWQSDQQLHELEQFAGLVGAVSRMARSVVGFLKINAEPLQITGCWANLNAPGAGHPRHSHPNNFLSGVYYVEVHPEADTINFHDPRLQTTVLRPPVTALTGENADQALVRVESGTLLLFPAWLEHSVDANRSEQLRKSVSFNLMFPRYAETLSSPLWEGGRRSPGRS